MNTIELFSGTASFSKVMSLHGHRIFTVDNDESVCPHLLADVSNVTVGMFPYRPDILWASPPCNGFSVAAIGKNWRMVEGIPLPKTESAKVGLNLVWHTIRIINELKPTWWFIENPRGMLRKMLIMNGRIRNTVTYCQYGDTRMKPTDIWTNADWWHPKPPCKNGDQCHERAPRGSRTGTQGIVGSIGRGEIPPELFEEMLKQMKEIT